MLVMMLRTVTVPAPCLWCSSRTTASAVDPCAARCWSSHVSAGVIRGSWSRSRCTNWTANAAGSVVPSRSASTTDAGSAARPPAPSKRSARSIGLLPRGTAVHDQFGETSEVFDQHDPERDRDRPELADRQRLHLLVGAHEAAQHFGIEVAVSVGDEGPGQAEHPRISGERPVGQLRQLPIVAGRQRGADFANLPFDEIIVVDQPFSRWRDGAALIDRFGYHAIGVEQYGAIVGEPAGQRVALDRLRRDRLRDREASRVLLQALDAEQLRTNGFAAMPGRCRQSARPNAVNE